MATRKKTVADFIKIEDDVGEERHEDEDLHAEQEVVLFGEDWYLHL